MLFSPPYPFLVARALTSLCELAESEDETSNDYERDKDEREHFQAPRGDSGADLWVPGAGGPGARCECQYSVLEASCRKAVLRSQIRSLCVSGEPVESFKEVSVSFEFSVFLFFSFFHSYYYFVVFPW